MVRELDCFFYMLETVVVIVILLGYTEKHVETGSLDAKFFDSAFPFLGGGWWFPLEMLNTVYTYGLRYFILVTLS